MARVLISIPEELLEKMDKRATKEYKTRSGLFREALALLLAVPSKYEHIQPKNPYNARKRKNK